MSRHSSTQVYNEFTKVLIKIHVAMSTEKTTIFEVLVCIIYLLFILVFKSFTL